jgi:hypothetical protein
MLRNCSFEGVKLLNEIFKLDNIDNWMYWM